MIRPPTGATRTYTFFPYTTLFRSYADDLPVRLLVGIVPRRPALARRRAAAAGGAAQRSGFTHRMLPRLACRWRPLARKQTAPLSFRRRGRAPDFWPLFTLVQRRVTTSSNLGGWGVLVYTPSTAYGAG